MSKSLLSYLSIITLYIKASEIVTTNGIQIINIHVLASFFYQDHHPREQVYDNIFSDSITTSFHSSQVCETRKDYISTIDNSTKLQKSVPQTFKSYIHQECTISYHRQMRHLHFEVSWDRKFCSLLGNVFWASTIYKPTLTYAPFSHLHSKSLVSLGNPFGTEFQ